MICKKIQSRLAAYSVQGLSPRQLEEVSQHLTTCSPCAAEWQRLQQTWQLLEQAVAPEPPPGMWPKIEAQIAARQARGPFWVRALKWLRKEPFDGLRSRPAVAGAMGLAVLLLVVGSFFLPPSPHREEEPRISLPPLPVATSHSYIQQHVMWTSREPLADRAALGALATLAQRSERET